MRRESLASNLDLDRRLHPARVRRAASKEPPHDEVVHLLVVSSEVVDVRSRVDRRMGLVILLTVARSLETAVEEAVTKRESNVRGAEMRDAPLSERSPARIADVLLDHLVKVEVLVELVRLGTRIAQVALLIQAVGYLHRQLSEARSQEWKESARRGSL